MIEIKLLNSIEGKKRELDKYRPFPPSIARKLDEEMVIEWTYNSNALEGNTISLQETELVLSRGLTIGGKSLKEHFEIINHKEAIVRLKEFVQNKLELTEDLILELHKIIMKNIDAQQGGRYRQTNVRILGAVHLPPRAEKIQRLMNELLEWYYTENRIMPVSVLAAMIHYKLVYIHPFIDGNGRTARLLMNLVLMQKGYPPAVILKVDRLKYYRVLKDADMGNEKSFINFIGRSIERSLVIWLQSIIPDKKQGKVGYITLKEASQYCDYSQEYLSLLARKGKLSAIKFNRNWMTTKEALNEYIENLKKADKS